MIDDIAMSLDAIIFMRRQSPDWEGLALDFEAGRPIDHSRYKPRSEVPGFPDDIVACIKAWNDTFAINFFRCRHLLKKISDHSLHQISRGTIISEDRQRELPAIIQQSRVLLFFCDDDDIFAPDTFERVSRLDLGQGEIAVFPLVRLGADSFTFVRQSETARVLVGARRDFGHRFQTNNYAISSATAMSRHLPHLKDHVLGSVYAGQQNLKDTYFDIIISATNKTPCSANTIGGLLLDPAGYRASIRHYVENLGRLPIPPELDWINAPRSDTIELFSKV